MPAPADAPRILILLGSDWSGINRLPPFLRQAGFEVDLFCARQCRLAASNQVRAHVSAATHFTDFVADIGRFLAQSSARYRHVLVADDPLLMALSAQRQHPWAQALLPATGQGLDFLLSKLAFPILAARVGIAVPRSSVQRDPSALRAVAEQLGYPLILKRPQGFSGQSVHRIDSPARLDGAIQAFRQDGAWLLQEWISGREVGATAVWRHGRLLAWFGFEKVRTWPGRFGPASVVRLCAPPQMQLMLEKMGQVTGFHGLGGADFIRDDNGNLFALEQHGRPNGQFILAEQAGIDLVAALKTVFAGTDIDSNGGEPMPTQMPRIQNQHCFPLFPQEAERQLSQQQWRTLKRWLHQPRYNAMLPLQDPPLLQAELERLQRLHQEAQANPQAHSK
ncbi:MAG TPA: hypothetical protein VM553_01300 [Dongiaceae bacterium]|nr:hypothetical protein [Dongiaceae bacterium]